MLQCLLLQPFGLDLLVVTSVSLRARILHLWLGFLGWFWLGLLLDGLLDDGLLFLVRRQIATILTASLELVA